MGMLSWPGSSPALALRWGWSAGKRMEAPAFRRRASSPAPIQLPAAAVLSALQDRLGPCPVLGCGLYELL